MDGDPHCQRCGVALTGQAVGELCANCLLRLALEPPPVLDELLLSSPENRRVRHFGDYELVEEVARGGMGVVYKARQVSLNRSVALKMILAGDFSSPAIVERFHTEAEAAARLEHPNIVPIYEIGAHEGQRYFSMRFLEGGTLTQAIAREKYSPRHAAELVMTVARAVHYAHQHGILHRDLKPGNILFDQAGQPYVADFGLAKVLEYDSTLTQSAAVLGTPSYMAPEQAAGHTKQLSTAADVYSLGAVLYELLTGRAPFRGPTPAETMRQVMEVEPERIHLANPAVDRDLETVCLKCLEKDPRRRYGSAEGLAEDLQHWLSNEPVTAVAPSTGYMFRKFARRNKAILGMSVAIATVMIVATLASAWQAIRATRAERLTNQRVIELAAERDAKDKAKQEAEAISVFLIEIFQSPDPARDGHTITVAETLDRAARKIETNLAGQPERKVRLREVLGSTYIGLGLYRESILLLEKVRDHYLTLHGPEHSITLQAISRLASAYTYAGRRAEAFEMRKHVLECRRRKNGPEHPATLSAMEELATSYDENGRRTEAFKLQEEVHRQREKVLGPQHADTLKAKHFLTAYLEPGQTDQAIEVRREVLASYLKQSGPEHPKTLWAMADLAGSLSYAGHGSEALQLREQILEISRRINTPNHPDTLFAMFHLAQSYAETDRAAEALKMREEVLELDLKLLGREHKYTLWAMGDLGKSYGVAGRWDEALYLLEEIVALRRAVDGPENHNTLLAMHLLASAYDDAGRWNQALDLNQRLLPLRRKVLGSENAETLWTMANLAAGYDRVGCREDAITLHEEVFRLRRQLHGLEHRDTLAAMTNLARSYRMAGRTNKATKLLAAPPIRSTGGPRID